MGGSRSQSRLSEGYCETITSLSMGRAFLIDKKADTKGKDSNEHCLFWRNRKKVSEVEAW